MAEVGNGSLSARKRRELNGADGHSPLKKIKLEDDDPPEANPNTIESVRHKNKEMALDLFEKTRRIAFLTQKCESLFRHTAVSQRAFRCIQHQWVQLLDDISSASAVLSLETPDEWQDVMGKSDSLGVLRLPTDVVTVALPEWFLAISRGDSGIDMKEKADEADALEVVSDMLDEKEKHVQQELQQEQARVHDMMQKLLAAIGGKSAKALEFKELIAQKREATAQVLELKDDLEAMKLKLVDMQTDLEAKEVERHRACRAYDRLKEYVEKKDSETTAEPAVTAATDSVKVENGGDHTGEEQENDKDAKASQRVGEKHVTLVDPDVKPSVDREVVHRLNADKGILLQKLKEERQHVESMRSELNRLRAVETACKQEEARIKQEFEATVARLQEEKAHVAEELVAARLQHVDNQTETQAKWKAQLDKIQEDAVKTKSKFNELMFKNTALREKLASFSAYRDQLSDTKSQHESLKREAARLQDHLKREKARSEREDKAAETKQIIDLRETLTVIETEREDLKMRVATLTASLEKSSDTNLIDALTRESEVRKTLESLRVELATAKADLKTAQAEVETANANHDAFKDENDALVAEIEVLGKDVEAGRYSKKKVLKQLDEKRQSAKKMQSELAKESDARLHATEELATIRLQVSSLKYVHTQQKAALEAAKEAQKMTEQELAELKNNLTIVQTERDTLATEKTKADREADIAKQMYKAESIHKQRQVLQDKSRPCEKCDMHRKKEADYEKRIAVLRASAGTGDASSGGLTDIERLELQDLRKQLKCSVCQDHHKDVIISKCSHLFCKECIDSNLRSRNRKCPTCKKMYGQDDVKSVWFT